MNEGNLAGPAIAITLVVIIIGAGMAFYLNSDDPDLSSSNDIDTGAFTRRLTALTEETISNLNNTDDIEQIIGERIPGWVDSNEYLIPGYSISVASYDVKEITSYLSASIPTVSSALDSDKGSIRPNSEAFTMIGGIPLVPSLKTYVHITLDMKGPDGKEDTSHISYSTETIDMDRALVELLDMIENDMNGWYSGLARDVEYMLNALVKIRAKSGVGTKFTDTNLHLLNDGDVELAVNFAIALRLAKWTGAIPGSISSEIDSYFSTIDHNTLMNPTGKRSWGEAEKENFEEYIERSKNELPRRKASGIMSLVETFGHSDSADLFLRFLYMDRIEGTIGTKEPLDLIGPLSEDQILDPRQPTDIRDPFSLTHHPGYPIGDGLSIFDDIDDSTPARNLDIDLTSNYIVQGSGLTVNGVDDFIAWYTNADLSLKDSDLIAYGTTTVNVTRCGLIPPPQEPPARDHRIQWNLDISGSIPIEGQTAGWSGNTYSPGKIERDLTFSFPVRIHTGTGRLYPENINGLFNINTGKQFRTNYSGGNIITPEANATEYFTSKVWPEMKDAFYALTSLSRTAGSIDPSEYPLDARQNAHTSSMAAISTMSRWLTDTETTESLSDFYLNRIKEPGVDLNDIGPIQLDGHSISFIYSPARDRMEMTSNLPEGSITIRINPITGGDPTVTSEVRLSSGIRIELDINDGTFAIHGNFGGYEINEGSMIPKAPSENVWSLLGSGTLITSKSLSIPMSTIVNPFSSKMSIPASIEGEAKISVLMTDDIETPISIHDLPVSGSENIMTLFMDSIRFAQENGFNPGIRVEMIQEDGPDIARSIVFSSLTANDYLDPRILEDIICTMVTSTRIHIPDLIGEEFIVTETVKGWNLDMQEDPTYIVHVSPMGTATTSYFSGITPATEDHDGWTIDRDRDLLPLW